MYFSCYSKKIGFDMLCIPLDTIYRKSQTLVYNENILKCGLLILFLPRILGAKLNEDTEKKVQKVISVNQRPRPV